MAADQARYLVVQVRARRVIAVNSIRTLKLWSSSIAIALKLFIVILVKKIITRAIERLQNFYECGRGRAPEPVVPQLRVERGVDDHLERAAEDVGGGGGRGAAGRSRENRDRQGGAERRGDPAAKTSRFGICMNATVCAGC